MMTTTQCIITALLVCVVIYASYRFSCTCYRGKGKELLATTTTTNSDDEKTLKTCKKISNATCDKDNRCLMPQADTGDFVCTAHNRDTCNASGGTYCEDDLVAKYCWNSNGPSPGEDVCEEHKLRPDQDCWQTKLNSGKLSKWHRQDKMECKKKWKNQTHTQVELAIEKRKVGECRKLNLGPCSMNKDSTQHCKTCKWGYAMGKDKVRRCCNEEQFTNYSYCSRRPCNWDGWDKLD